MRPLSLWSCLLVFCAGAAAETPQPAGPATSDICGSCHRDIYHMWRASAHAQSMDDPSFLESFRESQAVWGAEQSRICLNCHAPMTQVNGDWDLEQKTTWEGVSCEICHSLVSVDLSGMGPRMTLEPGPIKRGPIRDAESTAHEVAYSALHEEGLACAPCHEFVNADGMPIMTTFSEWRKSSSATRGTTCQTCHMGLTKANVVDPRVKRSRHAEVNLHEVPGGHSLDQLFKALGVSYQPKRVGDELNVEVRLANEGAGHAVPTGMPGRRIILTVEVDAADAGSFQDQRIFGKSFTDASGKPITRTWGYFSRGIQLDSDTRIPADQEWTERFHYPVPGTALAYLSIRLEYEHVAAEMESDPIRFTFFSERRILKPELPASQ